MQIGITNNLRSFLHYRPFSQNDECDPLYCWDASREKIDGRVMLVLCNVANRFCCVQAMRGTDWRTLTYTCEELIVEGLRTAGFSEDVIHEYMRRAGLAYLGRTHGRKAVGCMSRAIDMLYVCDCDRSNQLQRDMMHFVNDSICHCATRKEYGVPSEWMAQDLRDRGIDTSGSEPNARVANDVTSESAGRAAASIGKAETEDDAPTSGPNVVPSSTCVVCGQDARVIFGGIPYCLSCYNKMVERDIGAPRAERDNWVIMGFDQRGHAVEFGVERMMMPHLTSWSAHEIITDEQRKDKAYEGIEVSLYADPFEDSNTTVAHLSDYVQEVLDKPSTKREVCSPAFWISNGVHIGDEVVFANDNGWGRISSDEYGKLYLVIDGRRYSGDEFLQLLSGAVGFNVRWQIIDGGDPVFG